MRVIYHDVVRPTPAVEEELGAQFVDRETLLREADFLTLHVPLTPETHHLVGARELSMLKPTAFLINAARGKCVDEAALVEALQSKRLAGAGLDVFEHEPHVHPALLSLPNVVLAPHVGSGLHKHAWQWPCWQWKTPPRWKDDARLTLLTLKFTRSQPQAVPPREALPISIL